QRQARPGLEPRRSAGPAGRSRQRLQRPGPAGRGRDASRPAGRPCAGHEQWRLWRCARQAAPGPGPPGARMILYLHGFRSSPVSFKARLMAQELARRGLAGPRDWQCPQLPASPRQALDLSLQLARDLLQGADHPRRLTIVGSSLGGYYATWLAERLQCKAVLLNPAVEAARDLATQVGQHHMYHSDTPFEFRAEYVDELATARVAAITQPDRYFLVAATGDEVLDWREMQVRYAGCRQRIVQGSDHGLSDFERWLPEVLDFAF